MQTVRWIALGIIMGLAGGPAAFAEQGQADIRATRPDGAAVAGTATLTDTQEGLKIAVQITQAPPGTHGLHIHQFGACGEAGVQAGGHYNPDKSPHGLLHQDGFTKAHAGDLGNIEIGVDGTGSLEQTIPDLRLSHGPYTVGGRAVILHEKPDDFSQPTGNAGGRIGCGPIVVTGE